MRATNAGKRRASTKRTVAPIQREPRQRATSQYENMPDKFPGMHLVTVPHSHKFEGVDGPTVETRKMDGYKVISAEGSGILVPPNHELMAISVTQFEKWEKERHDETAALLDPPDQPQTAKEMQDIIAGRIAGGSQVGRADNLQTKPSVTLAEATATLKQQELHQQAALQAATEGGGAE